MTHFGGQPMPLHKRIEVMARLVRIELSRQHYRTQRLRMKGHTKSGELRLQERIVEPCVMRDEQPACEALREVLCNFTEPGGGGQLALVDAFDESLTRPARVDE